MKYLSYKNGIYYYLKKHGVTLLKLFIAPSESRLIESFPYIRSLVELKLYDDDYDDGLTMYEIFSSLVVNLEMDPSSIPLPRTTIRSVGDHLPGY